MYVTQIDDIKAFVSKLLADNFDEYLVHSLEIKTSVFTQIDGRLNKDFFDSDDELDGKEYVRWADVKGVFFQAIRGKRLPISFKIVFMPTKEMSEKIIETEQVAFSVNNISALSLNVIYERGELTIVTGSSYKIFTLDKTMDNAWESYVKKLILSLEC